MNVILGNGDGTFQEAVLYASGSSPAAILVGDFNGDGKPDLALASPADTAVNVLFGNGDGTFGAAVKYAVGSNPSALAGGDLNSDGREDLAVADANGLTILLGRAITNCATIAPTSIFSDSLGGPAPLTITSSIGSCAWNLSTTAPWIIITPESGSGPATAAATIEPNTDGADRNASVVFAIEGQGSATVPVSEKFTVQLFADVPPSAYYFDAANLLYGKHITAGCGSNPLQYCPTLNIIRSQMAVFIVRAVLGGDNFTYSPTPYFTDVQPTDFGFAWIQKMYELGITNGCGPALYCPNNSVTRAQMAVFIIRARYGSQTVFDYPPTPYFTDVPETGFAYNYIQRMKEDNITSGCGVTSYCPNNPVTRGDMAVFVMRGAFNQLLPVNEPVIVSATPFTIQNGTTATLTVVGMATNFAAGSTAVNPVPGLTVNSVTVTNSNTLQVSITVNTVAVPQPLSIWITDPTEEAVLPNGLVAQ